MLYDGPKNAKGNFKRAREIGEAIADLALKTSKTMECVPVTDFKHASKTVFLPVEDLLYENSLNMHLTHLSFKLKEIGFRIFWKVRKPVIPFPIDYVEKNGKIFQEAQIQVIKINDVGIVGIPGEVFSELGDRIIKSSKMKYTFVAELANGSVGYLFPLEEYRKGGYEMFLSLNVTGGTILTNKAITLLNSI